MNSRRVAGGVMIPFLCLALGGCGGPTGGLKPGEPGGSGAARGVVFVGFDASQPLVNALKQGKLQGLVVQNPFKMGHLGVKTLVDHLEKKEVPAKISTGETLVTPENMNNPSIADLLDPPQVE